MKVLLIDIYNFNKGGAETVCFNTGKLLEEYGHKVVYFTLKWPQNKPSPFSKYFPESKETRDGPLRQVRNLINYFYHFEAAKKIEQLILDEKTGFGPYPFNVGADYSFHIPRPKEIPHSYSFYRSRLPHGLSGLYVP